MHRVWKGVQSELQPDHAFPEAHWLQTVCLRAVSQGVPTQGGSETSQRDSAHGTAAVGQLARTRLILRIVRTVPLYIEIV